MRRNGWHTVWQGDTLVHARRWPARFDLAVEARLPAVARPERLARQVRQDVWRALRDLRGFAPCIEVAPQEEGVRLRAGGEAPARFDKATAETRIRAVLENGATRARWLRCAS
ncbi:hypothetical protein [Salipiger mucosus]|uniref:Uncharacterized protein n=1 Tax=Salipiger mucosus DSM 16094 TaxID=1123237 RepID=S9S4Q2_9RHOB|nr:hypothetical protein [Salipiger mucosus]EPX85160.1 hypothetical protein Salmuc_01116 [Salipiger mucosus DSM 16094]